MITHDFYIKQERLDECKKFIRTLSSARFVHNPIKIGNKFNIKVSMNVSDSNNFNKLFEKWYIEDNPSIKKVSLIDKFLNLFK